MVKMFPIEAGVIDKKDKVLPELPRTYSIFRLSSCYSGVGCVQSLI